MSQRNAACLALSLSVLSGVVVSNLVDAQDQAPAPDTKAAPKTTTAPKAQYMFVQNAEGVKFEGNKLVLKGVNPATIYFTDRPIRQAGHVKTKDFMGMWSEGQDSFAKDPPNASLTVFGPGGKATDMVVTISNPQLKGDELTYDIRTVQGEPPKESGEAALFIDWVAVRVGAPPVVVVPRRVVVVR
jgi:hypothetical protein